MPELDLNHPQVMAVINLTPDSFYDGGTFSGVSAEAVDIDAVLHRVEQVLAEGADLIDLGGESTRPGATPVSLDQERVRVLPALEQIRVRWPDLSISIDTSSPELMLEANAISIQLINDVRALQRPGAIEAVAQTQCAVCLMHMQGTPQTMQEQPQYRNVVEEVLAFLQARQAQCVDAGIATDRIIFDPGIGFGKQDMHNRTLLDATSVFAECAPVLVGVSRKSLLGRILGRPVEDRLAGSLALAFAALQGGAKILRVHDVSETRDIVRLFQWLKDGS